MRADGTTSKTNRGSEGRSRRYGKGGPHTDEVVVGTTVVTATKGVY